MSVEANPADLSDEVAAVSRCGVNRISIGGQSFDAAKLRGLERDHTPDELRRAVATAKEHIASVSLDLIFGTPSETLDAWRSNLAAAVALRPITYRPTA